MFTVVCIDTQVYSDAIEMKMPSVSHSTLCQYQWVGGICFRYRSPERIYTPRANMTRVRATTRGSQ